MVNLKTGWERKKPIIMPDYQTITNMLQSFLNGRHIIKLEPLGGGLSNSNIKITLDNKENYVLRIYNAGGIKGYIEKGVLHLVKDVIPVPQVLYHDFSLSLFEYPFLVLNWVKGFQLSELFITGDHASLSYAGNEVGKFLARIHAIQFSSPGFFNEHLNIQRIDSSGSESFLNILEDIMRDGFITENLGSEMVDNIREFATEQDYLLDHIRNQSSLVHSDFNPLNILIDKEGDSIKVTGILDWEFSFSNSPLIDIGNMLRYEDVQKSSFIRPFILSYLKNGGELPSKWLQQAKLLDVIALCDLANIEDCGDVRLGDIKELLSKTMNEWTLYSVIQENINWSN